MKYRVPEIVVVNRDENGQADNEDGEKSLA
jgi:hypothetical protein